MTYDTWKATDLQDREAEDTLNYLLRREREEAEAEEAQAYLRFWRTGEIS